MHKSGKTRQEAADLINKTIKVRKDLDKRWDELDKLLNCSAESALGDAVWRSVELLIDLLAESLGDKDGTINWFFWHNDCGKRGLQHSLPNGKLIKVKTVGNLLDVLGF